MSPLSLRLSAVSSHPRHGLIRQLASVLAEHGWILDSRPYSNLALAIHFEVSAGNLASLCTALVSLPMAFSEPSLGQLSRVGNTPAAALPEVIAGSIHVTFMHSEPDLHQEIPAVPG